MKKKLPTWQVLVLLLLLMLAACERNPKVFSFNNFSMLQENERVSIGVKPLPVPDISGKWFGLDHKLNIGPSPGVNGLILYSAQLIDTVSGAGKDGDSIVFLDFHFMSVSGKPYIEVIDWQVNESHGFGLTMSTYLKIRRLSADTMIVEQMKSDFTEEWLNAKGYRFFVPSDEKTNKVHPLYLTEDPERLAPMLKQLYDVTSAFNIPDTIFRKQW